MLGLDAGRRAALTGLLAAAPERHGGPDEIGAGGRADAACHQAARQFEAEMAQRLPSLLEGPKAAQELAVVGGCKARGKNSLEGQIRAELQSRGFPEPATVIPFAPMHRNEGKSALSDKMTVGKSQKH